MSVFAVHILSEGEAIDPQYVLTQVDIILEVNRIPYAQIMLADGSASKQEFALSSSDTFIPGKHIEIQLANEGELDNPVSVFKGIIVRHAIEADRMGSFLRIDIKDPAVKLDSERKNAVFLEKSDKQIIEQLIGDNGLETGELADTPAEHPEMIQYYCTDWDFILARAEANGCWIYADQGALSLVDPSTIDTSSPQHPLAYGVDEIYRLQLEADGEEQYSTIESTAWDVKAQGVVSPVQAADFEPGPGNLDNAQIAGLTGTGHYRLQSQAPLLSEELQAWADAKMRKSKMAFIRGNISLHGRAEYRPLEVLELSGAGDRFNGPAIITGVRHRIDVNGWRTDLQLGLEKDWYVDKYRSMDRPAAGLVPGIRNLQIGIAEAFEEDPEKHFRVKVLVPALGEEADPVWARLSGPDAGNGRGFFFRPEPGDELVLGFLNGDPRQAIILGSLYSESQPPPVESGQISEDNFIKGLYSREGVQIWMDDENKALHLLTSDGQEISLNETDKKIELKDVNGNTITMDDSGISIKSAANLVIEAAENVEIKGAKVDVK